jgi:hypothetical protein
VNLFGIRDVTRRVVGRLQKIIGVFLDNVSAWWNSHGDEIVAAVTKAYKTIQTAIKKYVTFIWKNLLKPILNSIMQLWDRHGSALVSEAQKTWKTVYNAIKKYVTFIWKNVVRPILNRIQLAWDKWGTRS